MEHYPNIIGFNTVNGKYCCNGGKDVIGVGVDVPGFNTVNGKYCCNLGTSILHILPPRPMFQYRKR